MEKINNLTFTRDGLYLSESTHVDKCKFFQIRGNETHGIQVDGGGIGVEYLITNCVIDNISIPPKVYDEGFAAINGPVIRFKNVRFTNLGKACLIGNGDHNEIDGKYLTVFFDNCIFENNSRRNPYIQYGKAVLNNCLIKNWGPSKYFYTKSQGLRVGKDATCEVNNTIFWQDNFFPGPINFITDVFSQYKPLLIPGNFRGAYAEPGGELTLNNCYANSKFIWLQGKNKNPMSKDEAMERLKKLENDVPKL